MNKPANRMKLLMLLLICMALFNPVLSETSVHFHHSGGYLGESGTGEAMALDAIVIRPIGLVTTVAGSAIYAISLPFSLLGGNELAAREELVLEPARYTFSRPLGEYEY